MTAWIGIIGTVIGAILGGGLALLNTHFQLRRQSEREEKKLHLSKLEDLHESISQFRKLYKESFLEELSKGTDVKQLEREVIPISIERIQMLVGFYAPELSEHLRKIEQCREIYYLLLLKYIRSGNRNDEVKSGIVEALTTQHREMQQACISMQEAVIDSSKKYI